LLSCVKIDGYERVFVVLLNRNLINEVPTYQEFFPAFEQPSLLNDTELTGSTKSLLLSPEQVKASLTLGAISSRSEDQENKPKIKVYKSKSKPNTIVTKIKAKPTANGTTKEKIIHDTKLPDGKKTKTKTVTKTPGGSKRTKMKTIVSTPSKNVTHLHKVTEGKNGKFGTSELTQVKKTPKGSE